MTVAEKRRRHRHMVAMAQTSPSPGFNTGLHPTLVHDLALPWPCRKDHDPSNIRVYADGQLRCRICDAESRQRNREKNPEREAGRYAARREKYHNDPVENAKRKAQANKHNQKRMEKERWEREGRAAVA